MVYSKADFKLESKVYGMKWFCLISESNLIVYSGIHTNLFNGKRLSLLAFIESIEFIDLL